VASCDLLRSVACADGYGRLAWDPSLLAKDLTQEWVAATWGADPKVVSTLTSLLFHSWQVFENYTAPLGVGFICGGDRR
jgi:alpha-glucuronidase